MNTVLRSELQEKYGDEQVFVVAHFDVPPFEEGFTLHTPEVLTKLQEEGFFSYRCDVEYNPNVRQPIPYVIIRCGDKIFGTRRLNKSGESRLVGKISLGIGGHINPEDDLGDVNAIFATGLLREVKEEVQYSGRMYLSFKGIINDNSNDVSRDHLGLVYELNVGNEDVKVVETDKLEGRFYTIEELTTKNNELESWSQIILDMICKRYL